MKEIRAKFVKRESELITTIDRVEEKMENNPVFPNPPAELAELKTLRAEFQIARKNARSGDKEKVAIKNNLKVAILIGLGIIADYVTVTCKGDKALVLGSGFDVAGETASTNDMSPSIEILEVILGKSGKATTRVKNVTGTKAYVHQYATEPPGLNTVWMGEGFSDGSFTFEGLASEKRHWFRVVAIGYNKQRAYSPIVSMVIQ
jgi:hypothetical protein